MKKKRLANYVFFGLNVVVSVAFVVQKRYAFIFNPAMTTFAYLIIMGIEKFTQFKLKMSVRIMVMLTLLSHTIIGEYFLAYNRTDFFDNFLHLFGTLSFILFAYSIIRTFIKIQTSEPVILTVILVCALGISIGTLFELGEYSLDVVFKEYNQRGLIDTDQDLLYNTFASIIAGIYLAKVNPLPAIREMLK